MSDLRVRVMPYLLNVYAFTIPHDLPPPPHLHPMISCMTVFGPNGKLYAIIYNTGEIRAYSMDGSFVVVRKKLAESDWDFTNFMGISFGTTTPATLAYQW